jgi:TPR repeat protein
MLYAAGQGVPLDYVEAYFWLDLAASGNPKDVKQEDITRERDLAASHLTAADLSQAQARASKWFAEHAVSK